MPVDGLYSAHAALIESVLTASCRTHRLAPDHADEFRSWARVRLLDNDEAVLRKFSQRSSLKTFLVTVIERLFLDWRNHEWGKWRPSSPARRLGPVAIELERLVLRDGCPFEQASDTLVGSGVAVSVEQCERVWEQLPRRPRRQRVGEEPLADLAAPGRPSDALEAGERRRRATRTIEALETTMATLPPGDQSILRLRYWSGVQVSRIAVMIGEDQKHLYRRFDRLLADLRRRLEGEGLSGADLEGLFAGFDPDEGDGGADTRESRWGNVR